MASSKERGDRKEWRNGRNDFLEKEMGIGRGGGTGLSLNGYDGVGEVDVGLVAEEVYADVGAAISRREDEIATD